MYERLYNYAVTGDYDMVWCDYYRSDGKHNEYIPQESDTQAVNLVGNMLAGSRSRLIGSVTVFIKDGYRRVLYILRRI